MENFLVSSKKEHFKNEAVKSVREILKHKRQWESKMTDQNIDLDQLE